MRFTMLAVAAGLLIGFLTGGRLAHVGSRSFRLWWLLGVGVALQAAGSWGPGNGLALALVVASYASLFAFAAANVVHVGMWLVALGIGLNLVVIAVNGGMPVRPTALEAAGAGGYEHREDDLGGKRHLERRSDRLLVLSDVIPVRPLREVVSFGDVAMSVGTADVLVHLMRPPRRRTAPGRGDAARATLVSRGG